MLPSTSQWIADSRSYVADLDKDHAACFSFNAKKDFSSKGLLLKDTVSICACAYVDRVSNQHRRELAFYARQAIALTLRIWVGSFPMDSVSLQEVAGNATAPIPMSLRPVPGRVRLIFFDLIPMCHEITRLTMLTIITHTQNHTANPDVPPTSGGNSTTPPPPSSRRRWFLNGANPKAVDIESAIWTYNPSTKEFLATWTNPDGCAFLSNHQVLLFRWHTSSHP